MLLMSVALVLAGGALVVARRTNVVVETLAGVLIVSGLILLGFYLQSVLPLFRPARIG